jgi:hypothetical protein
VTPDASIIWTIIGTLFSALCGLSVFAYRKLYADLEKLVDKHDGDLRVLTQRLHEVIVTVAEGKSVAQAVHDLKDEVRRMRSDLYQVAKGLPSRFPPGDRS